MPAATLAVLRKLYAAAPTLSWFVALWLAAEVTAAVVLPLVISPGTYAGWYEPRQAEISVEEFLAGDHLLAPDSEVGWRSSANRSVSLWHTDSLGARVSADGPRAAGTGQRVLLLGSSMINGGTAISYEETISAALERDGFSVRNFGTMLYGLDQVLLSWRSRLSRLDPDIVVVGIDGNPHAALRSIWVPLQRRDEVGMPFVKPRFVVEGDSIALISVEPAELLGSGGKSALVETFRRHDGYADRFERFQRFEQTPALASLSWGSGVLARRLRPSDPTPEESRLLDALLAELRGSVQQAGGRLVVAAMPSGRGASGTTSARQMRERVERWTDEGMTVVHVADVFERSGIDEARLYGADGLHLTGLGNQLIAEAIAQRVGQGG